MLTHLAVTAVLVAFAPATDDDALKKLEGTWTVTKLVNPEGESAPEELVSQMKMIIKGDTVTIEGPNQSEQPTATIKLDAKDTKAIDLTAHNGPHKDMTMLGIYKLEGEELTMCFPDAPSSPRPKDFEANKDAKTGLIVLKKSK